MTGLTAQSQTRAYAARRVVRSMPWRPVLASFVTARLVVLLAVLIAREVGTSQRRGDGLLAWDGRWYEAIAEHGYAHIDPQGIRFFPLLPLLARWLSVPLGGNVAVALVLIANVAALAYSVLVYRVAVREGATPRQAEVVVWATAFAPAAFVLVMGYTESLFGVLVCITFLAARNRSWLAVAVVGVLAGLLKPTGVLLVLPVLVEAVGGLRQASRSEVVARVVAVLSPLVGLVGYLAWAAGNAGGLLAPLHAQTDASLRGGLAVDPLSWILDSLQAFDGGNLGHAARLLHLIWAVVAVRLLVLAARRLPPSYTVFGAASLLLALTSHGMSSFERYADSALPLLLVVPVVLDTPRRRAAGLAVGAAVLLGYSLAAFLHSYVP